MASRPTRKPGPAGPSQPHARGDPLARVREAAQRRAAGDVEPPRRDIDAHHGRGRRCRRRGRAYHRVLLPGALRGARGRAAPHRPPLSMQAYAPRPPGPAASGALVASDTVRPRWSAREGAGPPLPHPGSPRLRAPAAETGCPPPPRPGALARSRPRYNGITSHVRSRRSVGDASAMLDLLRLVLAALRAAFRRQGDLVSRTSLLRYQLAVLTRPSRQRRRILFRQLDKLLWVLARPLRRDWRQHLILVTPDTVVRWHRAGWRVYWRWKSRTPVDRPRLGNVLQQAREGLGDRRRSLPGPRARPCRWSRPSPPWKGTAARADVRTGTATPARRPAGPPPTRSARANWGRAPPPAGSARAGATVDCAPSRRRTRGPRAPAWPPPAPAAGTQGIRRSPPSWRTPRTPGRHRRLRAGRTPTRYTRCGTPHRVRGGAPPWRRG